MIFTYLCRPRMRWLVIVLSLLWMASCVPPKPPVPQPTVPAQLNVTVTAPDNIAVTVTLYPDHPECQKSFYASNSGHYALTVPPACAGQGADYGASGAGLVSVRQRVVGADGDTFPHGLPASGAYELKALTLVKAFPDPPTRDYVLNQVQCFNTLQVETSQFGSLPWYETAWVSLNRQDRDAVGAQKKVRGCLANVVALTWDYGEAGTDYGTGQKVPPADFTQNPAQFRALAKEAVADGFTPAYYVGCDGGYADCLHRLPIAVAALGPQSDDSVDLLQYGVLFPCFDSCVPGYQPPSQVDDIILRARALAPNAYIGLELSTGYSFWWMGQDDYARPAGQALDAIYLEMDNWPDHMSSWQILARLVRPYNWPPDEPQDWDTHNPPFYPYPPTPRGPLVVHCYEYGTYKITHHYVTPAQMLPAIDYYKAAGCATTDM